MKIKSTILLTLITVFAFSQEPEIVWQQCYDDTCYAEGAAGFAESDQGFLYTTHSHGCYFVPNYHGYTEIKLTEVDSVGNAIWEKCLGGSNDDYIAEFLKINDSTYFILGKTNSINGDIQSGNIGDYDVWLVKINDSGDILWEQTYGSTGTDTPANIIFLPDGGFIFTASVESNGNVSVNYGGTDIWICNCDKNGNIIWEKTIGSSGDDLAGDIMINSVGNIMVTGSVDTLDGNISCDTVKGNLDIIVAELNMQGDIIRQDCYGGSNRENSNKIIETGDGYVILGTTNSLDGDVSGFHCSDTTEQPNYWKNDIWIFKTDFNGNLIWQRALGGYDTEKATSVYITNGEDFIIFGNTESNNDGDVSGNHIIDYVTYDIWIVKISDDGQLIWQKCIGGDGNDEVKYKTSILKKGISDYIIFAKGTAHTAYDKECDKTKWMFEINPCPGYEPQKPDIPSGPDTVYSANHPQTTFTIEPPANAWTFNWKMEPDTAGELIGYGLYAEADWAPDFSGTVQLFAQSANYCGESQWSEPKTVSVFNTIGTDEYIANEVSLKVYPNPAKKFVVFELNKASRTIVIYNSTGTETARLQTTGNRTTWHTVNIKPGLFFYRVETEGKVLSGKIVIQNE